MDGETKRESFEGWCVLELMGHRRLAGHCREVTLAGGAFLRIDIPGKEATVTQFYSAASIYCITPTDEATARAVAERVTFNAPVQQWELKQLPPAGERRFDDDEDPRDDDES